MGLYQAQADLDQSLAWCERCLNEMAMAAPEGQRQHHPEHDRLERIPGRTVAM